MPRKTCKYCGGKIRRRLFETDELYERRDYCTQPKCLREGKQERLEPLYAKDEVEAMRNHRKAFITRALFLMRWGMEPMEAFDRYGKAAARDWEDLFFKVKEGRGLHFRITIEAFDGGEEPVASVVQDEHVGYDFTPSSTELVMICSSMADASHARLLREETDGRKVDKRTRPLP